jgi:hypothetical protein
MDGGSQRRRSTTAVAGYAAAWVCLGAVAATLLILLLRGVDADGLPPLRETSFLGAVHDGDCRILRPIGGHTGNPPAAGVARVAPTRPGVYAQAPSSDGLVAALRRGVVELHYGAAVSSSRVAQLRAMQAVVPRTTIVTPNATHMPFLVAAVGWREILGCRRFTDATLDALRLFRGRNIGRGPDVGAP